MTEKINLKNPLLVDLPMPIITPRLTIRPLEGGDGAALHAAKRESWDSLIKWMIWTQKPLEQLTIEDDELFCRQKQIAFLSRQDLTILAFQKDTGDLIGGGGLHGCDWKKSQFNLGYWVRSSQTGQGYASEIANALIRYAFCELGARVVSTGHAEGNDASRRIIEKCGFKYAVHKPYDCEKADGSLIDGHGYVMTSTERLPDLQVGWNHA